MVSESQALGVLDDLRILSLVGCRDLPHGKEHWVESMGAVDLDLATGGKLDRRLIYLGLIDPCILFCQLGSVDEPVLVIHGIEHSTHIVPSILILLV